jgi:hypothetical protein
MLRVDEDEIVAGGLGDPGDVAGAPEPHVEAKGRVAGLHALLHRVGEGGRDWRRHQNLPCRGVSPRQFFARG